MLTASRAHHHSAFLGDNLCSGIGESLHAAAEVRQGGVLERSVCVGSDMDQCVWVAMGCLVEAQRRAEWWSVRPTNCRCVCVWTRARVRLALTSLLSVRSSGAGGMVELASPAVAEFRSSEHRKWFDRKQKRDRKRSRLAGPKMVSPGETKNGPAWRDRKRSRLARPKMVPPGGTENGPAWRER